jgi:hypothetical protein
MIMVGREGFEPPKRFRSGFTARPIWPLWNLPTRSSLSSNRGTASLHRPDKASEGIRTPDPLITNQPLYLLSYAGAFSRRPARSKNRTFSEGKPDKAAKKEKRLSNPLEQQLFSEN